MVNLDPKRITELRTLIGDELGSVVETLLESLTESIEQVETALADEQLDDATRAAHRARNDALLVGASQLLGALTDLETATRAQQLGPARQAWQRALAVWPATREELEQLAGRGCPQ